MSSHQATDAPAVTLNHRCAPLSARTIANTAHCCLGHCHQAPVVALNCLCNPLPSCPSCGSASPSRPRAFDPPSRCASTRAAHHCCAQEPSSLSRCAHRNEAVAVMPHHHRAPAVAPKSRRTQELSSPSRAHRYEAVGDAPHSRRTQEPSSPSHHPHRYEAVAMALPRATSSHQVTSSQ